MISVKMRMIQASISTIRIRRIIILIIFRRPYERNAQVSTLYLFHVSLVVRHRMSKIDHTDELEVTSHSPWLLIPKRSVPAELIAMGLEIHLKNFTDNLPICLCPKP